MCEDEDYPFSSCKLDGSVEILKDNSANTRAPQTIVEFFKDVCEKHPKNPALNYEDPINNKNRIIITYDEYLKKSRNVARTFIKLGLQPKKSIAVLAFNCPEWFYSEIGCISAGGILTGIYTTNSAEACHHILFESEANICVVDNTAQLMKVHSIKDRLPDLKAIIQINGPFDDLIDNNANYYKWDDIMTVENSELEEELTERENKLKPNECCMLVFTVSKKCFFLCLSI